jgi:hypothetical protein
MRKAISLEIAFLVLRQLGQPLAQELAPLAGNFRFAD